MSSQFGGYWPRILVLVSTVRDFSFGLNVNNTEFVEFIRNPRKHTSPDCSQNSKAFFQKCLQLEKREVPLQSSIHNPLNLSFEPVSSLQDYCKRQPMGVKKIKDVMKLVTKGTTLEDSVKSLSN